MASANIRKDTCLYSGYALGPYELYALVKKDSQVSTEAAVNEEPEWNIRAVLCGDRSKVRPGFSSRKDAFMRVGQCVVGVNPFIKSTLKHCGYAIKEKWCLRGLHTR